MSEFAKKHLTDEKVATEQPQLAASIQWLIYSVYKDTDAKKTKKHKKALEAKNDEMAALKEKLQSEASKGILSLLGRMD